PRPAPPGWPHLHPEHAHAVLDPPPPENPRSPQCHPDPRHNPPAPWAHHAHGNRGRDEKYRAEQHTRTGRSTEAEQSTRPGQSTEAEQSTRTGRPTRVEQSTRPGRSTRARRSTAAEQPTRPGPATDAEQSTRTGRPTGVEPSTRPGRSTGAGWPAGSAGSPRRDDHPLGAEEITAGPGRSQPRPADPRPGRHTPGRLGPIPPRRPDPRPDQKRRIRPPRPRRHRHHRLPPLPHHHRRTTQPRPRTTLLSDRLRATKHPTAGPVPGCPGPRRWVPTSARRRESRARDRTTRSHGRVVPPARVAAPGVCPAPRRAAGRAPRLPRRPGRGWSWRRRHG